MRGLSPHTAQAGPIGRLGIAVLGLAEAGEVPALAGSVDQAGLVSARWAVSPVVRQVVARDRAPGDV